jgi:putative endonuclease
MEKKLASIQFGKKMEEKTCRFLELKGYKLLNSNVRYKCGEIDLIMLDGNQMVFVEVRSSSQKNPLLQYSINFKKRTNLYRSIQKYIQYNRVTNEVRFDVVWSTEGKDFEEMIHLKNIMLF